MYISIHAPRVGSDFLLMIRGISLFNFYPRSPRGERPAAEITREALSPFLSTLPAWGATRISAWSNPIISKFLSTLPAWGATPNKT